jgi:hypothetical protein
METDADYYYYKLNKNGVKLFYSYFDNCKVPKSRINSDIIDLILPKNSKIILYDKIIELTDKRSKIKIQNTCLLNELSQIKRELSSVNIITETDESNIRNLLVKHRECIKLKKEHNDINDPTNYCYILFSNNAKHYYSWLTESNIAKSQIPNNIIDLIKIKDPNINFVQRMADKLDKRETILRQLNTSNDNLSSINDELSNMGINTEEDELRIKNNKKNYIANLRERKAKTKESHRTKQNDFDEFFKSYTSRSNNTNHYGNYNNFEDFFKSSGFNTNTSHHNTNHYENHSNFEDFFKSRGFNNNNNNNNNTNNNNYNTNNYNTNNVRCKYNYPPNTLEKYKITNKKQWKEWLRSNHFDKGGDPDECQNVISAGKDMGW